MDTNKKVTFEEVFKQNERRIHYHIHKLRINDPYKEFYAEGLYAMWMAHKKYDPDKGTLATYFNYSIRNRLIDKIRKKTNDHTRVETLIREAALKTDNGNRFRKDKLPLIEPKGITLEDSSFWDDVRSKISANQWKWVNYYIIEGMSTVEIAKQEGVSIDAVKSWGREARKKLRAKLFTDFRSTDQPRNVK